jgi:hypothetical protein
MPNNLRTRVAELHRAKLYDTGEVVVNGKTSCFIAAANMEFEAFHGGHCGHVEMKKVVNGGHYRHVRDEGDDL